MKLIIFIGLFLFSVTPCNSQKTAVSNEAKAVAQKDSDTVRIANDEYEYEIIITEVGFSSWLAGHARPRNYHSELYLETKNQYYVTEWNSRVLQPNRYSSDLYLMQIDYSPNIHYGYEVNYLLYNYFIFFQDKYKQNLNPGGMPYRL